MYVAVCGCTDKEARSGIKGHALEKWVALYARDVVPDVIKKALAGEFNDDAKRIAEVGLEWVETLIKKNVDYGSSVWQVPVLAPECDPATAIRVRMSDKISRIRSLLERKDALVDESLQDSIADLGAYCLLLLAKP